ncbi:hypothetical protein [Actinopolymorpha cephalotaxi]|uniref:RNA polymerase subunit RPABC4/transcription elongation factor Spt4 n=1 Tax=Actinopolymorpha cephalotaxi TaxID=504797 RepID=A0ABX2SBX4_9ACTN|nr:hypothetical protein [Actinopolymorpha cephalotaxi]NYH85666.1 RNA polymerase subunit RPABC4/transcription elongation factor Spt4 [Actinopolymorpha cephalotaxi]
MSSGPAPAGSTPTPEGADVCPVCREPLRPTSPSTPSMPSTSVVDVPTRSCPYDCALTVCAEEWERAVLALARERRGN